MAHRLKPAGKKQELASFFEAEEGRLTLEDGSRIGVIGGGPAGSFFTYFLLKMADSIGIEVSVDIYEPRLFQHSGPAGCNHCGGIVSESLVQLLATEGINLPPSVVQRGIDSYVLHMDIGDVRIDTPGHEKRIAGVFRGNGPREGGASSDVQSFDGHLLDLARQQGAQVVRKLVTDIAWEGGRPIIRANDGEAQAYDLVAVAAGVNSKAMQLFRNGVPDYRAPEADKTFICEFHLGQETIQKTLGTSMHVFLLDLPRLEFAALIPKGDFVTLCLIGEDVDEKLVESFLASEEVRNVFPSSAVPKPACHCFPRLNMRGAVRPYADRIVWVGDCSVARLYKDGVGSAYRTAKAAARTAVFNGISSIDFEQHFWPTCGALNFDNFIARFIFMATGLIQKATFLRRTVLRMTATEQRKQAKRRYMSSVLWDVFTGSAPYKEILVRSLNPFFPLMLCWNLIAGHMPFTNGRNKRSSDER